MALFRLSQESNGSCNDLYLQPPEWEPVLYQTIQADQIQLRHLISFAEWPDHPVSNSAPLMSMLEVLKDYDITTMDLHPSSVVLLLPDLSKLRKN